jgi:MarR family transcriptional regulator, 2-MHQ and catechol-resistance regulon repressor
MPTHYQGRKETIRALNAYINLARASDSILARLSAHSEAHGLTLGQFGILEALLHLGPMFQKDLGRKLLRSGGNITTVLDNLENLGFVRRERQRDDRRKILIRLTAAGRRFISAYFPSHAAAIAKEMDRLSPKEQEELRRLCRKLGRGEENSVSPNQTKEND